MTDHPNYTGWRNKLLEISRRKLSVRNNPFRCGEPVSGDFFSGRYRERELLLAELGAGHNVLLTGPRQFGKSSMAKKVMAEFERRGVMSVYIDLDRAFSPARFIEVYLSELLRSAFRQAKELRAFIEGLNHELKPHVILRVEQTGELVLDLSEESDMASLAGAVLNLAQHTVDYKNRPCILCFDEVSRGGNLPANLRKLIIEAAASHAGVSYFVIDLESDSRPKLPAYFHLPLPKIEERYLKAHIKIRFENAGYRIPEKIIDEILDISEGHPHFTQMICRELWNQAHSSKIISSRDIAGTQEALLQAQSEYYTHLWRDFSLHQKNLLLAICRGGGNKIFSQNFVARYGLGSFSTVQKSLSRLSTEGIIERRKGNPGIRDMFFGRWITRRMI